MIVKGKLQKKSKLPWILLLLAAVLLVGYFLNTKKSNFKVNKEVIYCDAETVIDGKFMSGNYIFNNGKTQSSEEAHSGKYSSKINDKYKYGVSYHLKNPVPGSKYVIRVWRKTDFRHNALLVAKQKNNKKTYTESSYVVNTGDDGWEQIEVTSTIPHDQKIEELTIYPYLNIEGGLAYFDDLTISVVNREKEIDALEDHLHIYLDKKALVKLNDKRRTALKKGLLQSSDDDWVKAKITIDDDVKTDVKLRLKGDWTDHLRGDYWSYRVKMPKDQSWNRLQTFSLQDPKTRGYLSEWLYHKALEDEDIITPRYGFVKLRQNSKRSVLYAYEEHFEKQIAEFRNRREGVILKFGESAFWDERARFLGTKDINTYYGNLDKSEIRAFKESKTMSNPKLREQFDYAAGLMKAYTEESMPASQIFDIDRMAKLYALAEVLEAHHGLIWHNQRYYYNPVTRKLEPIGFDGYTESGPFRIYRKLFFGEYMTGTDVKAYYSHYQHMFRDEQFVVAYNRALLRFTRDKYINELLAKHEDNLSNYEYLIRRQIRDYTFDKKRLLKRARKVRKNILPYNEHSLRSYRGMVTGNRQVVSYSNYHPLPLYLIGSGTTSDAMVSLADSILVYSNPMKGAPTYNKVEVPATHKYLFFKLAGGLKLHHTTIKKWSEPTIPAIRYSDSGEPRLPSTLTNIVSKNETIIIKRGIYKLTAPIIIPSGYTLTVEPGTVLDFTNGAYLLSYGTTNFIGTKGDQVTVTSSDNSSQGVVVIGADSESKLSYTTFSNLGALEENEWQITGAVTFYESDVDMDHVTITKNSCEDALNLVRCKFKITKLNINHTKSDGFDGDFCTGTITDSYFYKTGNDGLDFSGSTVKIENVKLESIGDKGVSAGEEATLTLKNIIVNGAEIAVASKDLSRVTVDGIDIKNCRQGFAAFRKKPEFGGGFIDVKKFTCEDTKQPMIADSESEIKLPMKK